jgi:hypothetical protein
MTEMIEITDDVAASPVRLTQSVLQIAELLGLNRAELSRLLHLKCGDVGQLGAVRETLVPGTVPWQQALLLVRFFRALHATMRGDGVAMWRWLRMPNAALGGVPLMLLVDDDRLAQVLDFLAPA